MHRIDTPELDKMHAVHDHSQAIGEFLEWLGQEKGLRICTYDPKREEFNLATISTIALLAEYFEIDLATVEAEKVAILESIRSAHA